MASFGPPPENNALSYPGISGLHFNPVEAQKVYAEGVKKEKELRYVHSYLDAYDKLGLDEAWANDVSRGAGLMPDYESLGEVYKRLGWEKLPNGRVIAPDPVKLVKPRRRKSRGPKRCSECRRLSRGQTAIADLATASAGLAQSVSAPSLAGASSNSRPPTASWQGAQLLNGKRGPMPKAKQAAPWANSSAKPNQVSSATRKASATWAAVKPLRPGQRDAPAPQVRGARYSVLPETALVHSAMRRSASAPGFATATRAAARDAVRRPASSVASVRGL